MERSPRESKRLSTQTGTETSRQPKKRGRTVFVMILIVLCLALAGAAGYYYVQYQQLKKDPTSVVKAETDTLVTKVGKLIALPTDETPTVATVLDKDKLKDQAFFADANNGDKILIYTKSQKAIIYREADNQLINVGPIAITDTKSTNTTTNTTNSTTQ